ncbi:hypothetical protein ACFPZL_13175, partial [Leucobacter soli]
MTAGRDGARGDDTRGAGDCGRLAAAEIALVAEQLWPGCARPDFRAVAGPAGTTGWVEVERHAVLERGGRIELILPARRTV